MIIYKLTSPESKSYIGLTINPLDFRWKQHVSSWAKLKKRGVGYEGYSPKLYSAFDQFSPDQWFREIIFEAQTVEELCEYEIQFIDYYDTIENGYNVLQGGQQGLYGLKLEQKHKDKIAKAQLNYWSTDEAIERKKILSEKLKNNKLGKGRVPHNKGVVGQFKHSEESILKMSLVKKGKIFTEEHKMNISLAKIGKPKSAEHRQAISIGRKGKKQPDSQKQKVREANQKTWIVTLPDGVDTEVTNLRQWCLARGLDQGNMSSVANGRLKHYKGHRVKIKEL